MQGRQMSGGILDLGFQISNRRGVSAIQPKAPEKTGALQELRQFGWCIGRSAIFGRKEIQARVPKKEPSPRPSQIRWEREREHGTRCTQDGARSSLVLGYCRSSFQ